MKEYLELLTGYIIEKAPRVLKNPYGKIKYKFIDPGEGYQGSLWDWDSYWTAYALCRIYENYTNRLEDAGVSKALICSHVQGCVLNFLSKQTDDGFTPIMVTGQGDFCEFFEAEHNKGTPLNQMKPFLCQAALNASKFAEDYTWFDVEKLIAYIDYYEKNQRDERTGLFVWQDDIMIGVDNNPTVFFRPQRSSADIYLNSFIYAEYQALCEILRFLDDERVETFSKKAEDLKGLINTYMWDERDGIYYSQDVGFHATTLKAGSFEFHKGLLPTWKTIPLRIRFWGCFLPLYVGLCSKEQEKRLVEHLKDETVFAKYGIRTLASDETMYNLEKTCNPSNWLGAIWGIPNYCVYKGLRRYGQNELADQLQRATIELFGQNLKEHGHLFESYQPDTGEPNLNPGFLSWNLLVLDMVE